MSKGKACKLGMISQASLHQYVVLYIHCSCFNCHGIIVVQTSAASPPCTCSSSTVSIMAVVTLLNMRAVLLLLSTPEWARYPLQPALKRHLHPNVCHPQQQHHHQHMVGCMLKGLLPLLRVCYCLSQPHQPEYPLGDTGGRHTMQYGICVGCRVEGINLARCNYNFSTAHEQVVDSVCAS